MYLKLNTDIFRPKMPQKTAANSKRKTKKNRETKLRHGNILKWIHSNFAARWTIMSDLNGMQCFMLWFPMSRINGKELQGSRRVLDLNVPTPQDNFQRRSTQGVFNGVSQTQGRATEKGQRRDWDQIEEWNQRNQVQNIGEGITILFRLVLFKFYYKGIIKR